MEYGMGLNHADKATIALLRAELATLRTENERMRAKLRQIQSLSSFASTHDLGEIAKDALK